MIYEVRTYDLKPHTQAEVEKRFGEAYEKRKKYSEMAAFWHTEIGPLNQIIHVWPYKDLEERDRIRAAAVKDRRLAAEDRRVHREHALGHHDPVRRLARDEARQMGPYFEMRTYTYAAGELSKIMKAWEQGDPGAREIRPGVRDLVLGTGRPQQVRAHLALSDARRAHRGPRKRPKPQACGRLPWSSKERASRNIIWSSRKTRS